MKLKNKKTREIADFHYLQTDYVAPLVLTITLGEEVVMRKYNSFAEFNEEWGDLIENDETKPDSQD